MRERYDIIAFDPRGIGRSSPVTCDLPPEFLIPPRYARDAADFDRQVGVARRTAEGCTKSPTAHLLPHISTQNVARDLDRIRAALGEQRISYLGFSYGTYLGAVYASLFPRRTDRVVLNSVVGPGGMNYTSSRRWAQGMEIRFPDFAEWAAARHETYGLGRTSAAVRAKYFELAERLDQQPVNDVDGAVFRWLTFAFIASESTFSFLAESWQAAEQGTIQRPGLPPGFDFSGLVHLTCNNGGWPQEVGTYRRTVDHDRVRYPMFGASGANISACAFWPSAPPKPPVRISDRGPSNILMVQNLRDPGTVYAGALEMRHALGGRARMVTVNRGDHLVYLYGNSPCADEIITSSWWQESDHRPTRSVPAADLETG